MNVSRGLAPFLMGLFLPAVAAAQSSGDVNADEIRDLLNQQTRGLVLAPSEPSPTATGTAPETGAGAEITPAYTPVDEAVRIDVPIVFDFDSALIRADQRQRLDAVCDAIRTSTVGRLQIIGHTDASGSAAYNANLSRLRADEVKRFLVDDCGIQPERLEAVGVGEEFPANPNDPTADENRRVEFQALS